MDRRAAEPGWKLSFAGTFVMQALVAFLTLAMPVLGPLVTAAAGRPPEAIGTISSLTALGTLWFLAAGTPVLERFGPLRSLQLGALLGALGLALALSGSWGFVLLGAFAIGAGYGPSAPAGSDILARTAPKARRALIFSTKQAAVPAGGAAAGLVLPLLAALGGWRAALGASVFGTILVVLLMQPLRAGLDAGRDRRPRPMLARILSPRSLLAPFAGLAGNPRLILVSYCGFGFACVQGAVAAFAVTFLVERFRLPLSDAALAFTLMQAAGILARILMGWIADRVGSAQATLAALALVSSLVLAGLAAASQARGAAPAIALLGLAGFFSASWNGVVLSEVAALARAGEIATATASAAFFIYIGYSLAPLAFALLLRAAGSYALAFASLALISLSVTALLLSTRRRP
jgi:MFS family permease